MSDRVDSAEIEGIVGRKRHRSNHYARAVTTEQTVYILHSQRCRDRRPDLRECPTSRALDLGISEAAWRGMMDRPVQVTVNYAGQLVPVGES
jgi:hypothetical protein